MNEEMLLRLINDNTIAQDRVCQSLDHVSEMMEKATEANERMTDAISRLLTRMERDATERNKPPPDIGPG